MRSAAVTVRPVRLLLVAAVLAAAVVALWFRWYGGVDVDEGWLLTVSWQVSQGLVLYKDIFEFHPPGAFHLLGELFRVVGPSLVAAKLFIIVVTLLTAVALDRLSRLLALQPWQRIAVIAVWGVTLTMFPLLTPNHLANLGSIWAVWLLVRAWRTQRPSAFAAAALAAAATAWIVQTRGLAVVLAGLAVVLTSRRRQWIGAYLGGLILAALPVLAFPPTTLWHVLVVVPSRYYLKSQYAAVTLPLLAGLLLAVIGVIAAWRRVRVRGFGPLWLTAALLAASIWSRAELPYLAQVLWPFPILLFAVLEHLPVTPTSRPVRVAGYYAGGVMAAQLLGWAALNSAASVAQIALPAWRQGGDVWSKIATEVQRRTAPGDPIFATPYLPGAYFFAQRPNATPYHTLVSEFHPPEVFAEVIARLEQVKPKVVLRALDSFAVARGFHRDGTVLDRYLDERYQVEVAAIGGYRVQLLRRRVDR